MDSDHMSLARARSNTLFSSFACRIGMDPGPHVRDGAMLLDLSKIGGFVLCGGFGWNSIF